MLTFGDSIFLTAWGYLPASFPTLSPPAFVSVIVARIAVLQGTEINAEVRHGRNALHYAADAGKVPIVRFLLNNMAIIDVRNWVLLFNFACVNIVSGESPPLTMV